jgi:hypothetical protein
VAPDPETSSDAAVILGTALETDPTSNLEWDTTYTAQVIATNMDLTNHHLVSTASLDVIGSLDFDITFNWDRIESPTEIDNGDGTTRQPKSDDYRVTFGVG